MSESDSDTPQVSGSSTQEALDVAHLARLAQLALSEAEITRVKNDLQNIIGMINTMQAVNTDDVEPMAHPLDATARLRDDEVTERVDRDQFQAHAPDVSDGYYLVPRVVE